MESDVRRTCETHLLDDIPAVADAFASDGDVGPHQRVADAIASLIESTEEGGKAIGLEGGWGSGKSTVVRLLADRLSNNDHYKVVLFDAWAHEGDPLRRTFIESVCRELCRHGWADKEAWTPKLEELANRRKTTNTTVTPKPTRLGKAIAISLLFVPLGSSLIAGGFRQGVTLGWGLPPNMVFCSGSLLILSPVWVLLFRALYLTYRYGWRKNRSESGTPIRGAEDDDARSSDWAFLINREITDTHTETIETPDPTSLEFDGYFGKLMEESLRERSPRNTKRRLLLVLDNLDRVDAHTALSVWGTLQTFLHDRDHDSEPWFKQLWVVVPYDPIRIRRLWNQPEEHNLAERNNGESGPSEARRTTESFLDKSFQVRFHVAPPVLSDWKSFLYDLVAAALPRHMADQHILYRVFDHCRARDGGPPTPRELKLYVNQIGAIHRQWQHEFPIGHIAFFVLARKEHDRQLIDELRKSDFPTDGDFMLLDDDLKSSLAGLAFNVKASKGLELLLTDPIAAALKGRVPERLTAIAERNGDGFWAVLEIVATSRWHDEDLSGIAAIATQLRASGLLEKHEGPEVPVILGALRRAGNSLKSWLPRSDQETDGISDLLRLQSDSGCTLAVLRNLCTEVAKADPSTKGFPSSDELLGRLFRILDTAKSIGHNESIPDTVMLPYKGEGWISACESISNADAEGVYWALLLPSGTFDDVSQSLVSTIGAGTFSATEIAALQVTQQSSTECDWDDVCKAIVARLNAAQSVTTIEMIHLLSALFELEALGVAEALSAQAGLAEPGHLLHHFHRTKSENDPTGQAAIILAFASQRPQLTKPTTIGNSEAGYTLLTRAASSPEEVVVSELYVLAKRYGMLPKMLTVIDSAEQFYQIFVECLRLVADSNTPMDVFTSDVIREKWRLLRKHLNDVKDKARFQKLVGTLAREDDLCRRVQDAQGAFDSGSAILFLEIARGARGSAPEFNDWCRDGLSRLSEEQWKADFTGNFACCALSIVLVEQAAPPTFSNSFSDALQDHAKSVMRREELPPDWIQKGWPMLLNCIEDSGTRRVLRERLVETAVGADGSLSDEFFDIYGTEIADSSVLASNERVLSHFFTALVRERHVRGLQWLSEFATKNPSFLGTVKVEHTVDEFAGRLQGFVDDPEEHEARAAIEAVAAGFGIRRNPMADESNEQFTGEGEADTSDVAQDGT